MQVPIAPLIQQRISKRLSQVICRTQHRSKTTGIARSFLKYLLLESKLRPKEKNSFPSAVVVVCLVHDHRHQLQDLARKGNRWLNNSIAWTHLDSHIRSQTFCHQVGNQHRCVTDGTTPTLVTPIGIKPNLRWLATSHSARPILMTKEVIIRVALI